MDTLRSVQIKELGKVVTGHTPPTARPELFGGKYLFIKPSDLYEGQRYAFSSEATLSDKGYEFQKSKLLPPNTVCVVCIGTIGKLCLTYHPSFTNQQLNSIVVDTSNHNPKYVFYLMHYFMPNIKKLEGGSASGREHVNKSNFANMKVRVHSLPLQRRIAAILSAYDDLIENNAERIKMLEEMAQLIYREWFVNFRFPGHEDVPMVASELGEIPEGWRVGCIENLVSMEHKSVQPDKHPDEVFKYYSFPAFDNERSPVFARGDEIKSNKYLVPQNVVLFPKLNLKFPRIWLPYTGGEQRPIASTEYVILKPRGDIKREYLFTILTFPALVEQALSTSGGTSTSHQRISPKSFVQTPIVIPSENVRQNFEALAVPMYDQIQNLRVRNQNLRQTRDLLLPKLISGELDVSRLEADPEAEQAA